MDSRNLNLEKKKKAKKKKDKLKKKRVRTHTCYTIVGLWELQQKTLFLTSFQFLILIRLFNFFRN